MMTEKESRILSIIRVLAMIMIISCHILQGLGNIWAFVLNVGVQVFFFLSGYLYGLKKIGKSREFYKKRFVNIYVPYAIWLTLAFTLLFFFSEELSFKSVAGSFLCLGTFPPGLEHLWFIPVILVCYILLPLFSRCLESNPKLTVVTAVCLFVLLISVRFHPYWIWISVYYTGFLCGRYPDVKRYILFLAIGGVLIMGYNFDFSLLTDFSSYQNLFLHGLAGIAIFLILRELLCLDIFHTHLINISHWSKGTYEIYLTHQLFILWPLSLLFITKSMVVNILLLLALTVVSARLVRHASKLLTGYILPQ